MTQTVKLVETLWCRNYTDGKQDQNNSEYSNFKSIQRTLEGAPPSCVNVFPRLACSEDLASM